MLNSIDNDVANIGPWVRLAEVLKLKLIFWPVTTEPYPNISIKALEPLLSEKTRLVTFTACSNILGMEHILLKNVDRRSP
jgi:selenocysteine lyase/cysteine desulfurase